MRKAIGPGTILIKEGTLPPEALRLETESFVTGWTLVKNVNGYGVDQRIREVRWAFFCLAGEISATGFGFEGQETQRRALHDRLCAVSTRPENPFSFPQRGRSKVGSNSNFQWGEPKHGTRRSGGPVSWRGPRTANMATA
jgi:hypothetical protein